MEIMNKYLGIILLFGTLLPYSISQTLPAEEVKVVKNFEARLADATKVDINPQLPQNEEAIKTQFHYDVTPLALNIAYEAPKIRPLGIKTEKLPQAYNGFAQAGYGYPNSPFAKFGYNLVKDDKLNLGILAQHYSANNTKNVENQRFMDNDLILQGTYFSDNEVAFNGKVGLSIDDYFWYGYPDSISVDQESVKRKFTTVDLGFNLFNGNQNKANFNYSAGFDLYHHRDNQAAKETGFLLDLGGSLWISKKHPLTLKIKTDLSTLKDTMKQSLNNFNLMPSFTFHGGSFRIKAGANFANNEDQYYVFPDVSAAVSIAGNQFILFGGWVGDLAKNNFRSLTTYNPFLTARIQDIRNTHYNHYFGGLKGNVSIFNYEFKGGAKQTENLALFKAQNGIPTKFQVLYDDVNLYYGSGTLIVKPTDQLEILFTIAKNFYDPDQEEKAWFLPSLEANAAIAYKALEDRLNVRLEGFYMDKVNTLLEEGEVGKSNVLLDLNLHADFFITPHFGVFAMINNIPNTKHRRWLNYPTFGLNAVGGLQVRF